MVDDPYNGRKVAPLLGLKATKRLGEGGEGTVWRLADGGVLKLTKSVGEAAAFVALARAIEQHGGHPGVPAVRGVHVVPTGGWRPVYAIVRSDVPPHPRRAALWEKSAQKPLLALERAMLTSGDEQAADAALADAEAKGEGALLRDVRAILRWLKAVAGVSVQDISPDNLGVDSDGNVMLFDLGAAGAPSWAYEALKTLPRLANAVRPVARPDAAPAVAETPRR